MSQQTQYNEEPRGYQAAYTPTIDENSVNYNRRVDEAQKIGSFPSNSSASAGQRLALAIVSVSCLVVGLLLFAGDDSNFFAVVAKLVALIVVAVAAIAINAIFSGAYHR